VVVCVREKRMEATESFELDIRDSRYSTLPGEIMMCVCVCRSREWTYY
jgi:hypothetical protein